jgi:hypothetical protein
MTGQVTVLFSHPVVSNFTMINENVLDIRIIPAIIENSENKTIKSWKVTNFTNLRLVI